MDWVAILAFGQSMAGLPGMPLPAAGFTHHFLLFLHELLLVYWLGPDIAVFILSRSVVNTQLGMEQRVAAGRMMRVIDRVPRVCLALFLTIAGLLSQTYGIAHSAWQMTGIVLLGPVWLAVVLGAWFARASASGRILARLDLALRMVLVFVIPASVAYSMWTGRLADTPWLTAKLLILAGIMLLSLLARLRFQRFFDQLEDMAEQGDSARLDARLADALKKARPLVHGIWVLLLLAAWLGVVKPGDRNASPPASIVGSVPHGEGEMDADRGLAVVR